MNPSDTQPQSIDYREKIAESRRQEEGLERTDRRLTHLRAALFLAVLATALLGWLAGLGALAYTVAALLFLGFVGAVGYHDHLERQLFQLRSTRQLNEEGIARQERDWDRLPIWEPRIPRESQTMAHDLDVFGRASVFQLTCTFGTELGKQTLADWLLAPAEVEEIQKRQTTVADLATRPALREQLHLMARLIAGSHAHPRRLIEWAEGPLWLAARPWLLVAARSLPLLLVMMLMLTMGGLVDGTTGGIGMTVLLGGNALLSVLFAGRVQEIFLNVSSRNDEAANYSTIFQLLYDLPAESPKMDELQRRLHDSGGGVIEQLGRLRRLMWFANISQSAMLFLLLYLPLQLTVLWDFHVLWWLERWQRRSSSAVREWFDVLGEFEALSSLATLYSEHPDWCFPQVKDDLDAFSAIGLGHPLLQNQTRVTNDVEVGPPGTFLLVTGSNMSGKSTLLRSIGTNILLAQAGGPVCAEALSLPAVSVATSMRIHDSLADGVSFFMAELRRLKEVVDLAHEYAQNPRRRLVYLFDEILQGTNSRERHVAVCRVLQHLLESGAIGAISTHDLELGTSTELAASCQAVHFREVLHGSGSEEAMTFDYLLRPGVATTTNALKLLELVGLSVKK